MTNDGEPNSTVLERSIENSAEHFYRLQVDRLHAIKSVLSNFKKDARDRKSKSYFSVRFKKIEDLYAEFSGAHQRMLALVELSHAYFKTDVSNEFEEAYVEVFCALSDAREELHIIEQPNCSSSPKNNSSTAPQNIQRMVSSVAVPQVPIPKFSGRFIDWPSYSDSFTRLVHRSLNYDVMQKFHLLRDSLPQDRDLDVHAMSLTAENYATAWDLLEKRYHNPRVLFMHHMHSLLNLPCQQTETSDGIKSLLNTAQVCINGLTRLELPIGEFDHWIAHVLSTKISKQSHEAWEHHLGSKCEIPTYKEFETFLNNRVIVLDAIENRSGNPDINNNSKQQSGSSQNKSNHSSNSSASVNRFSSKFSHGKERKNIHHLQSSDETERCACCGAAHSIRMCQAFKDLDAFGRQAKVKEAKLCYNCLARAHPVSKCTSAHNCRTCGQRHHTLIHLPSNSNGQRGTATTSQAVNKPTVSLDQASNLVNSHTAQIVSAVALKPASTVLLATAMVSIVHPVTGMSTIARALIDDGSEGTVISEKMAHKIGLQREIAHTSVSGVGSSKSRSTHSVNFMLRSCVESDFSVNIDSALVLPTITSFLPSKRIRPQSWPHIQGLVLADPTYHTPGEIDLLIGSDMAAAILLPEMKIGRPSEPVALNSHLGWLLYGRADEPIGLRNVNCHHLKIEDRIDTIETMVRGFFEHEQVPAQRTLSEEEQWTVDFFKRTHIRQENGKYQVRLPLKSLCDPSQTLGKSEHIALNRFYHLERQLIRNPDLCKRYSDCIQEYFDLNQIEPTATTEDQHCVFSTKNLPTCTASVLAHHAVIKEDSVTTKLRVVFDASCKTSNGRSLNDILCIGPALQNDLSGVLINWRVHEYVFTTDIQKMYRCVDMHSNDKDYQRIWWYDSLGNRKLFALNTVTFGTASAPCTAILVLHQVAEDERSDFPLAEHVLKHETYVDDVQSGSHTIASTIEKRNHVIGALKSAGMELRKWGSNDVRVLEGIPAEHQSNSASLQMHNQDTIKILGMHWLPNHDCFKFQLKFEPSEKATKRSLLSTIARLYDPLGFIAPIVVTAKVMLKDVWSLDNIAWDSELPSEFNDRWLRFTRSLPSIENISIPRWINYDPRTVKSVQLHAFCDGSTLAYAAAVYIRFEFDNHTTHTHLVVAKTRVVPNRPFTIPKVELNGAELAVQLVTWVTNNFRIKIDSIHYWSDATVVLYWIHGDVNRWKTYVTNRVVKILTHSKAEQWNHVGTKVNPADCATRGLSPDQLANFDLWWSGPEWLSEPPSAWSKFKKADIQIDEKEIELKPIKIQINFAIHEDSFILKCSSYQHLIRVNAWIQRFKRNGLPSKYQRLAGSLSVDELHSSLLQIVHLVQLEAFGAEISALKAKESLPSKSKISGLAPFIDDNILRVRGRLQRANLPYSQKHPIILPRSHHFTELLIKDAHSNTLHGGAQIVLSHLRRQFWIVDGRRAVQLQIRKCVTCFKVKPEVMTQRMGNLPYHRVNPPERAFLATGVDYTGAFELKASRYRGNTSYKGYIAIFICLASKAIHLEAVTGMSTQHFLWALQRFVGRRGLCHDMYSDNGTNFVGANRVINGKETFRNRGERILANTKKAPPKIEIDFVEGVQTDIIPTLTSLGIRWHFNPPHSPNFGGIWEANVKSVKFHLHRVLDYSHLTYEELSTILVRIESVLNSRPLCPLTMDPDDLDVLTPGHFLIGGSLLSLPETPICEKGLTQKYAEMQKMVQSFWQKWSADWLSHLQNRPKWHKVQSNLQLNDMVIVKDDRFPPSQWLIGRVIELHPGADDLVRVATIKTAIGVYKRSISKLCRLPIPNELNNLAPMTPQSDSI